MRSITLGNGRLGVGADALGRLRDLWFPTVGLENHLGGIVADYGVEVEGRVFWADSARHESLPSAAPSAPHHHRAHWAELGVRLEVDFSVDADRPLLRRRVSLHLDAGAAALSLRVLFHHDFQVMGSDLANSVRFLPGTGLLHHWRRDRHFMIGLRGKDGSGLSEWTLGRRDDCAGRGTRGYAGHRPLPRNPVAMGAGDSLLAQIIELQPGGSADFLIVLAAGLSPAVAQDLALAAVVRDETRPAVDAALPDDAPEAPLDRRRRLIESSPAVIRSHQAWTGAVLASLDTDLYVTARDSYAWCWPRDGAFVAHAMEAAGDVAFAERFFRYCSRHLGPAGALPQRLDAEGNLGSTWHAEPAPGSPLLPIQEDETALVTFALARSAAAEDQGLVDDLLVPTLEFLLRYRDQKTGLPRPSFDLWEERCAIHLFTVSAVIAALESSAPVLERGPERRALATRCRDAAVKMRRARRHHLFHREAGRYARAAWPQADGDLHLDLVPDASQAALFLFDATGFADTEVVATMAELERRLFASEGIGGCARYEGDIYCRRKGHGHEFPGNPWLLTTLWIAEWRAGRARDRQTLESAWALVDWVARRGTSGGLLPEQVDPIDGESTSVLPLTWSHAGLILAAARCESRERELAT